MGLGLPTLAVRLGSCHEPSGVYVWLKVRGKGCYGLGLEGGVREEKMDMAHANLSLLHILSGGVPSTILEILSRWRSSRIDCFAVVGSIPSASARPTYLSSRHDAPSSTCYFPGGLSEVWIL